MLVDRVLDRAQTAHPHRRAAERADRRVGVGPEVAQTLSQRLALNRAAREIGREHTPLLAIPGRLGPNRALRHDLLQLSRIHTPVVCPLYDGTSTEQVQEEEHDAERELAGGWRSRRSGSTPTTRCA